VVARCAVLALATLIAPAARPAIAHPLHTTLAQLSYDPVHQWSVSIRVFAADFAAAVQPRRARGVDAMPPDSAMFRYVSERFFVVAPGAGRVALRWCGVRREGDVLFVCLRAAVRESPAGSRMTNMLLNELFADQVNIVQASYDDRSHTVLFTSRDAVKRLP
jgi:hypothetical protein